MERLTAELFNTFVQRSGDAEPYFTEYCDGKTVTCPGMKQWGTVDRAREGMNALQILRYYYGNRVQLVTTDNIAAIPSSYPGSPLRRGSTGTNVRILQKQLSRIAKDYPSFGKPAVTGTFDEATENSVKKFQKQFSLTADGVVGRATWNKVSFIYVSVKDLAELTSEGETAEGTQSTGGWPGTVLRRGSTGSSVEQVQFWLSDLAQFDSSLMRVTVDGSYGAATVSAVEAFQTLFGLTPDGVVGRSTWNKLKEVGLAVANKIVAANVAPGQFTTTTRAGSSGTAVRETLATLGLEKTEKAVLLAVVTEDTWKAVRTDLRRKMRIDVPGTGIAFTVPLSSIGGRRALMFLTQHQPLTLKEESTLKDTRYELLLVIANQGHTGTIMDAARAAGAGGGTVIHAKGTGMEGAAQFLGVELVNEKELVLIVARTPEKNRIMKAIMDGAGPKAGAIVFSLPVTDTAGLRLLEDEEPVQETSAQ